jgi:ElaB/YqjD/DUF883 family membrane-anchored ribosome-binding protein
MSKDTTSENLRAELKSLADTLEEVLNSSADKSKEEVSKLRSKAEQALKESRYRLGETGDAPGETDPRSGSPRGRICSR